MVEVGSLRLQVGKAEAITVEAAAYDSCMSIIDSDHKPVWSRLQVTLPVVLQDKQRRQCSHLLKDAFLHSVPEPPRIVLSSDRLFLHPVRSRLSGKTPLPCPVHCSVWLHSITCC